MKAPYRNTLIPFAVALLTACGGGGSSGGSDDSDRNSSTNYTMSHLQQGIYGMRYYAPNVVIGGTQRELTIKRVHMWVDSANVYHADTEFLSTDGWVSPRQYDENIKLNIPDILALTASGWQNLEEIPCSASTFQGGVAIRCGGVDRLTTTSFSYPLTNDSLADVFAELANYKLFTSNNTPTSAVNATSGLTSLLGANTFTATLHNTLLTDKLATDRCRAGEPGQPIAEWNCFSPFSSTTWADLALADEDFNVTYYSGNRGSNQQVFLDGDLANGTQGDIVISENDVRDEFNPGDVIGTWEKRELHGQTFIKLNLETPPTIRYQALAIVNGEIVEATYAPAGNIDYSNHYYNREAGTALSDAAVGIFPISDTR